MISLPNQIRRFSFFEKITASILLATGLVSSSHSVNVSVSGTGRAPADDAIRSGVGWYDNNRNPVSVHGACIVKENGLFYLIGEFKSDSGNAFTGFSCYSSPDLYNWTFENIVLPVQPGQYLRLGMVWPCSQFFSVSRLAPICVATAF